MIALPPDFDVVQWFADVQDLVLPFASISMMFAAFLLIKKICNRL